MITETIKKSIQQALTAEGVGGGEIVLEHPEDPKNGDYSSNVALRYAKELKMNPKVLAEKITAKINQSKPDEVIKVEVAGPGFINFYLSADYFAKEIFAIAKNGEDFGKTETLKGKKVVIEYTDPNPFKQFHIGHLMSNTIGEALSRIIEVSGAEVKRACYQGDVGRHVALTMYGIRLMDKAFPEDSASLDEKVAYLGRAYALGATAVKDNAELEKNIQVINKKIYDKSDGEVNDFYNKGREWSLEHFEELYAKLGTHFDQYFFESATAPVGMEIVKENLKKGVFEESEGAVIFSGEKHDLHTRVFITREGLPTYEAKELGLAKLKYDVFPFDTSIVITASEQSGYFNVLMKVIELVFPKIGATMRHVSHGMLRLPSGKMSSRTGDVITGESLIAEAEKRVEEKVKDRDYSDELKKEVVEKVAIGALKYSILKQSPGKDIIFDFDSALSFEGDSGPYLQYAYVRARSVLEKAGVQDEKGKRGDGEVTLLEQLLPRLPEVTELALKEMAPQYITTYLIQLAAAFNHFYATNKIIDAGEDTDYRLALTWAFATVMKNGLTTLGLPVVEKM